ncbi:FAD-dependent oxidoreductase [Anatilimnocola sp. NA78]|uniref:FAD-dependent oxidoreductase n=1 Tax=Anatilimnocola sp. NA78 TaxID=3415683 RepID=UPI003CE45946
MIDRITLLKSWAVFGWETPVIALLLAMLPALLRAELPTVDLSGETDRHSIVAAGTPDTYQGHPTTLLLPDGRTMFAVWTLNHGGPCGPLKRSEDGGRTWSELLTVPESWRTVSNCPSLHRLTDPQGVSRLFVFAGQGPDGAMHSSHSTDEGRTWTPVKSLGLKCVMPFCTIVPIDGGKQLLGLTNIRRPGETKDKRSNIIAQSVSTDGGLTWSKWRIILDLGDLKPCEPALVRSPNGKQLLCLLRENVKRQALFIDEGRTWSKEQTLPSGLWGDRHMAAYAPDGRLVVTFRDTGPRSPTKSHFVAWVGKFDDIQAGRDGQYRIKLLHSHAGNDCGYPGLEVLPDGEFVATTYVKYRPGPAKHSVVATRFKLRETDTLAKNAPAAATKTVEADIVIYGGTSGGVVAAVQASRMGKKAVIVEPGKHLGGMTSGGLSAVDIGDPRTVGGIAREYFTRLVASYGKKLEWDKAFTAAGGGPATGGAYSIEPHVAEDVFNQLVREAGVPVYRSARLAAVKKDGARLIELTTDEGLTVRGKMFIDATYEGDLMAKAGVTYTVRREGNKKYNETYNGIYYDEKYRPRTNHLKPGPHGRVPGGQGVWDRDFPLDPYVVPGKPDSGLLPLIEAGDPGVVGDPAPGVQAYCFRLCLTKSADRLPIEPPSDYDPKRYEIVARFIAACEAIGDDVDLRWFSKHDALPNNKWDFNTATFGGNLPGVSWAWPEASYSQREKIAQAHEDYHRGLLHFLATDSRVPAKVRGEMNQFGLPRDEFRDNGGWPHQLYIREARRMVSDLVITEHHTFGRETAANSVSLGSYGTDTHEIRRIVKDGVVTREGKTAGGRDSAPPYPIGYAAIVPRKGECDNLLVTFALSASHTAFSSIRMEPVLMVTSQSAATAASLAIDESVPVQQLDYAKLRKRLDADKQIVEWKATAKKPLEK